MNHTRATPNTRGGDRYCGKATTNTKQVDYIKDRRENRYRTTKLMQMPPSLTRGPHGPPQRMRIWMQMKWDELSVEPS